MKFKLQVFFGLLTLFFAESAMAQGTTTWTGNPPAWTNGAPDASTNAIIASNTSPGSFTCKDLTINASRALVFGNNQVVTVTGTTVTNNGFGMVAADATGTVVFDNDGNSITLTGNTHSFRAVIEVSGTTTLVTNGILTLTAPSSSSYGQITGTGTISGNITMQTFLNATSGRYFYLGSPFTDAILSDYKESGALMVSSANQQGSAWEWDAANAEWDPAGSGNLSNVSTRGRGYALYAGMNGSYGPFLLDDGDLTGVLSLSGTTTNASTVSIPLSYNDGQATGVSFVGGTGVSATEGWNLVSNPYGATYDWDGQSIPTDMSSAIYRFNGTNYSSYVKGAGTASRYIAPFQGFFIQLTENTATNLDFDRGNRNTNQQVTRMKATNYAVDGLSLHIEGLNGAVYDDLFVGFEPKSTTGFDNEWDARKLINRGATPNFYVQMGPEAYSVCRVPVASAWSFPLKLDYEQNNDILRIHADRSQLQSFGKVILEDRKLDKMHDLTSQDYNFIQDNSFGPDRFILHFSQPTISLDEPAPQEFMVYAYADNQGLNLELGVLHNATVEVYNLAGQLIHQGKGLNGKVTFPEERNGLYIMTITAGSFSKSVKVIR